MVAKYVKALEEQEINSKTDEIWVIDDVPKTWRSKTEKQILADGYVFDAEGHAILPLTKE